LRRLAVVLGAKLTLFTGKPEENKVGKEIFDKFGLPVKKMTFRGLAFNDPYGHTGKL
jgi:hypothetical protein